MPRDIQRNLLYQWQWDHVPKKTISLAEANDLSKAVCHVYKVRFCPVVLGRSDLYRRSYYKVAERKIVLAPDWGLTDRTVIHELAHHVEWELFGSTNHGPKFRFFYIQMLAHFCDQDLQDMYHTMNLNGMYVAGQLADFIVKEDEVVDVRWMQDSFDYETGTTLVTW